MKKILFTFALVVGLSVATFAQKDEKKPPPKPSPPVVNPQPKPPPKDSDKPKKPSEAIAFIRTEDHLA
jgi:hypothetical protein